MNKSILKFLVSLGTALALVFMLKQPEFTDGQVYTLFLLFFSMGLWLSEAIPGFAVSLFIIGFLVFAMGNEHFNSAPEKIDPYVNTFSSSVIWLMMGGLFLASAMQKTKLDERIFQFAIRISGSNPRHLLFGLMTTTMFASMIMSSTAAVTIVIAAITPLITSLGKRSGVTKSFLVGVPLAATVGGMGTIIGSPANAIAVGELERIGIKISFLDWMLYAVPVAIVLTTAGCMALVLFFLKDKTPIQPELISSKSIDQTVEMKRSRRIVVAVLSLTILLWVSGSYLGITIASVSAVPLVLLTLTGIITSKDMKRLPWDTLLLVAGGLSLGVALEQTELITYYSAKIVAMGLSPLIMIIVIAYALSIISNFSSSSALTSVFVPLALVILPSIKMDAAIIIAMATSTSVLLPISDIPNALAYSTGYLESKDFRVAGLVVGLLGPILVIAWLALL